VAGEEQPPAVSPNESDVGALEETVAGLISDYEALSERIGRILHDEIGQVLSGVGLQLEAMRLEFQQQPEIAERTAELQSLLEQAMSRVRGISNELNPSVVERAGLHFALEGLAARYQAQFGCAVRQQMDPNIRLPRPVAIAFYRVAEYAFAHAVRRSRTTRIDVKLKSSRDASVLEIKDDGDAGAPGSGGPPEARVELLKLHYHARRAGIGVTVESSIGKGTIVRTSYRNIGAGAQNSGSSPVDSR
jgi:chemotaxis family two-component system sensor kinase Cph1